MDFSIFFNAKSLHKTPRVGIHYEQKTTPDLIWCVAHVILEITEDNRDKIFSDSDVRSSTVFNSLMQDYFSKAPQKKAENEYNKVSSYQLGLLVYSGVLDQIDTRPKKYKIRELEILNFLATNDLNSVKFLTEYTQKFLQDNGLLEFFNTYRSNPTLENYERVKEAYWEWAKVNTAVKGTDRRHTHRVFNKIFNVYCYLHRIPGEDGSNIIDGPCPYSFLIYNRKNFRDENLPVGMTRSQYRDGLLSDIDSEGVVGTMEKRSKDSIRQKYGNVSEIREAAHGYVPDRVVEVHHILPKHSYAQFSLSRENLIALTPDQHRSLAHNGSYRTINADFQRICLKKKLDNIGASIDSGEKFYSLKVFINMLNACYHWTLGENTPRDQIISKLSEV